MASTRLIKTEKDGTQIYEINVSQGRNKPRRTLRWKSDPNKSDRTNANALKKAAAIFEEQIKAGNLKSKREIKAERAAMPTVSEYGAEFLKAKAAEISTKTIEFYGFMLEGHIYPIIGSIKLNEVQPLEIKKLLADMTAKYSYSTRRHVYKTLRQLFEAAITDEYISKTPVKKEYAPKENKDTATSESSKAYTINELKAIKKKIEAYPLKWQCIINILIDTGIRRGEVAALRWQSIDFASGAVLISQNVVEIKDKRGKADLQINTPKSGAARVVYISPKTAELLKDYAAEIGAYNPSGFIFTQADGITPITPHAISSYVKKIGKLEGIDDLHPHKLRHSFASVSLTHGADIVSVSGLLGHSSPDITLGIYSHSNEDANKATSGQYLDIINHED